MTALGFRPFDADNHYYEPTDAFTRHIPKDMFGELDSIPAAYRDRDARLALMDLDGFSEAEVRRVMSSNALSLLNG